MLVRPGRIVALLPGRRARVAVEPGPACAGCGGRCGLGLLAASGRTRGCIDGALEADGRPVVGDAVRVEYAARRLLLACALVYGLPALGLMLGAALGAWFVPASADLPVAVGAVTGIGLGCVFGRHLWRMAERPLVIVCGTGGGHA